MAFIGYSTEFWINLTIRTLILWMIVIPIITLIRYIFNPSLTIVIIISFPIAILTSVLVSKIKIDLASKIIESNNKFAEFLVKVFGKKENEKRSCIDGNSS